MLKFVKIHWDWKEPGQLHGNFLFACGRTEAVPLPHTPCVCAGAAGLTGLLHTLPVPIGPEPRLRELLQPSPISAKTREAGSAATATIWFWALVCTVADAGMYWDKCFWFHPSVRIKCHFSLIVLQVLSFSGSYFLFSFSIYLCGNNSVFGTIRRKNHRWQT